MKARRPPKTFTQQLMEQCPKFFVQMRIIKDYDDPVSGVSVRKGTKVKMITPSTMYRAFGMYEMPSGSAVSLPDDILEFVAYLPGNVGKYL
jgi:hypothetical protein